MSYPKRAVFRALLRLAWERGEFMWSGRLVPEFSTTAVTERYFAYIFGEAP